MLNVGLMHIQYTITRAKLNNPLIPHVAKSESAQINPRQLFVFLHPALQTV